MLFWTYFYFCCTFKKSELNAATSTESLYKHKVKYAKREVKCMCFSPDYHPVRYHVKSDATLFSCKIGSVVLYLINGDGWFVDSLVGEGEVCPWSSHWSFVTPLFQDMSSSVVFVCLLQHVALKSHLLWAFPVTTKASLHESNPLVAACALNKGCVCYLSPHIYSDLSFDVSPFSTLVPPWRVQETCNGVRTPQFFSSAQLYRIIFVIYVYLCFLAEQPLIQMTILQEVTLVANHFVHSIWETHSASVLFA